jgi:hypothetical protein
MFDRFVDRSNLLAHPVLISGSFKWISLIQISPSIGNCEVFLTAKSILPILVIDGLLIGFRLSG